VSVDAGDFLDLAGGQVPDVEVAPAGGKEDAVAGRRREAGGFERVVWDVKGGEDGVGVGSGGGDVR